MPRRTNKKSGQPATDNDTDTDTDLARVNERAIALIGSGQPARTADTAPDTTAAPVERAAGAPGAAARRAPDPALDGLFEQDDVEQPPRGARSASPTLEGLDELSLYTLRAKIDALLPPRDLASVDLAAELMLQYMTAKALMSRVSDDAGTPANQKAQVVNSCTAILKQIAETQTRLYDAERLKLLEQAVEKAMQGAPRTVKEAFMERYAALLAEAEARKQEKKAA